MSRPVAAIGLEDLRHLGALEDLVERDPLRRGRRLRVLRVASSGCSKRSASRPCSWTNAGARGLVLEELVGLLVALADPRDVARQGVRVSVSCWSRYSASEAP